MFGPVSDHMGRAQIRSYRDAFGQEKFQKLMGEVNLLAPEGHKRARAHMGAIGPKSILD